jgi:hypothetical protein
MADPRALVTGRDAPLVPQPLLTGGPAAPPLVTGQASRRQAAKPLPLGAGKATGISADPTIPSRTGVTGFLNKAMSLITGVPIYPEDERPGPVDFLMAAAPLAAGTKSIKALLAGEKAARLLPQSETILQSASPEALARLAEQFPAFATDLRHYRTGEALPAALGHLSDVLVQTETPGRYALKPEVQARIAHFLELGKSVPRQANWQGSTSDEILKAFANDKDLADIWARMVGATSAGTGVPRNTQEAVQGMRRYLMTGGKPFTEHILTTLPGGVFGLPKAKYGNMNLAQLQEMLSGDKVEAFAQLMRDYDRIPLDRHAIYALGGVTPDEAEAKLARHLNPLRQYFGVLEGRPPKFKSNGAMYGTLTESEAYERVEQALGDTLRALDPEQPLKDVFAQMWEGVREHRGGAFQGGPIDLMGPRGLLERGAMTDPKRMLRALKMTPGKEWTPALFLAALASLADDARPPGTPPAGDASPAPDRSAGGDRAAPLAPPRTTPR